MLSREIYDKLNKRILINKELIPKYEEIEEYYKEMMKISNTPEILEKEDVDIMNVAELYCLYYGIMSLSTSPGTEDTNFKIRSLYSSIFSNIANSITAIIFLVRKGLDYQANVIIRQMFEMCMILLNIGIDQEKSEILMQTEMTEENLKVWRKNFSPKELNKSIEQYEKAELADWRKRIYSEYSNFSHNEFLSFLLFSFAKPKDENEMLTPNIWGGYVSRVNDILYSLIGYLWYTSKVFMNIMVDKNTYIHKEMLVGDDEGKKFWNFAGYLFFLLDEYYMICFNKNSSN